MRFASGIFLRAFVGAVVASFCAGHYTHSCAQDYSQDLPKIPGRYADLGTHRLYYHCLGSVSPTVVIDNGIASAASEWYDVQKELARTNRVCVYDRAGYGWSEPGPAPRDTRQIADELRRLLEVAEISPPFVLVGHSFGGFTARYLAHIMAGAVAGVVLIDASSAAVSFERSIGSQRNPLGLVTAEDHVPSDVDEMSRFLNSRRKAVFTQMDEISHFERSAAEVAGLGTIGELPLLVIARDRQPGVAASNEQEWRDAQRALAGLSTNSRFVIANGSGHQIHIEQPQFVVQTLGAWIKDLR